HSSTITHSAASSDTNYSGISISNVVANITDNDFVTPGVTLVESASSTDVDEEGPTTDTYTVVLASLPMDTVTITVDPDSQAEVNSNGAGNSIDLIFLTTNWDTPQTITVKADDDTDIEGSHTATITHMAASSDSGYNGISIGNVVVNITDNDFGTPGVTLVESGGSTDVDEEGPTTDTYTMVLDSIPTDTVTIAVDPDPQTEVNSNGAGNSVDLTFLTTNWDSPQTITVTAIDDTDIEGAHSSTITHSAASSDTNYHGISIADIVANVTDNDSQPPGPAGNPTPTDSASDIAINSVFSWTAGQDALSHDVYFGVDFNDVNDANNTTTGIYKGNQTITSYDPGLLALQATYYWRIDEKNDQGTAKGTIWSFSTSVDSDGDNIRDSWELLYGLDPNDAGDADLDLDSDTYNNLCEFLHQTDPNNSGDVPTATITITVPRSVSTIQRAIAAAIDSDVVMLDPGSYYELVNFSGKAITLCSTDPNDPNVVAATIIDANDTSFGINAVTFNANEDANSVLEGMTITGGYNGIDCTSSSPVVRKCMLINNNYYGFRCGDSASPVVTECDMQNNTHGMYFSGYSVTASVSLCDIRNNSSHGIRFYYGDLTLTNCVIANNGYDGLILQGCDGNNVAIVNCTIVNNGRFGIDRNYGTPCVIRNCIMWDNDNDSDENITTYSCISDLVSGMGNIRVEPMFVDAANGDYHLKYMSPCIDVGDPNDAYGSEPSPQGSRVNIGAYGNTIEATSITDSDGDGLADEWEQAYWPQDDPNLHNPNEDPDGDGLRNKDEYTIDWDPIVSDANMIFGMVNSTVQDVNYPSITLAIGHIGSGDILVLDPNTYYETINYNGKAITIRSTDPNDPNVVTATVIDANDTSSGVNVVTFDTNEDANSVLEGITLTGG
ncbi:right-handed parallel beta-helix repeat-containing protein, partial [Planctomycetota bacterium]